MSRLHWVTATAFGVGLLVGCSTGGVDPVHSAPPEATAPDAVSLPLDQYRHTTWDTGRIILAREILIHECMRDHSAEATPPPDAAAIEQDTRMRIKDIGPRGNKRRYGITEPLDAATYGYHLPSTVEGTGRPVRTNERMPSTSCVHQADTTLGEADLAASELVKEVSTASFEQSLAHPRVVGALGQWSACMKAGGYDHATPMAAMAVFDLSSATVSPAETATAAADVECKLRTGLVGTWQEVESTLQRTALSSRDQAFRDVADQRNRLKERVAGTIDEAAHGS